MNKSIVGLIASVFATAVFAQTNTIGETAPNNSRPVTAAEVKSDVKGIGERFKADVKQAGTEIKQTFKKPEAKPEKVEAKVKTAKHKAKARKAKAKEKVAAK
jgi:hypothetical protein